MYPQVETNVAVVERWWLAEVSTVFALDTDVPLMLSYGNFHFSFLIVFAFID